MNKSVCLVVALFVAVPLVAGSAKNTAKPVATIGNVAVSEEELERAVGMKLTRLMTDVYNIRRGVLDELINTRLLEAEAARRKVSVDELLKAEVAEKIAQPDVAELERLYEGVADRYPGLTKEQAIEEIAKATRDKRSAVRKMELIHELREAAGVQVNLQPPRVAVAAEGPSRGNANAPVTIVEFSDFECQFCGRAVETLKKIEEKYGDDVRITFRDYPLPSHRTAKRAAEAAHCAGDQDQFWAMHDKLFSKGGAIPDSDIFRYAAQINLDQPKFVDCMTSGKYKEVWKSSVEDASKVGVQSTPTFFVNGRLIVGAAGFDVFSRVIDEELAAARAKSQKVAVR